MKKIALSLISLSVLVLPVVALANGGIGGPAPIGVVTDLTSLGNKIINAAWIVFTIFAIVCFVFAGILFLTAGGDPEKIKSARNAFLWGVVGVVVGIIAYSIIAVVKSIVV